MYLEGDDEEVLVPCVYCGKLTYVYWDESEGVCARCTRTHGKPPIQHDAHVVDYWTHSPMDEIPF